MIQVFGKVIKKVKRINPVRVEVLVDVGYGDPFSLQLRPAKLDKLVDIDVGARISFKVENELSKTQKNFINNLTVIDAERV